MQIGQIIKVLLVLIMLTGGNQLVFPQASAGIITGIVTEKSNGLPLPGVNVSVDGTYKGTVTDTHGQFIINEIETGSYSLTFSFISYESLTIRNAAVIDGRQTQIDVALSEASVELNDVVVVASRKTDSEISVINSVKNSPVIVSGISAQLISRSQDRDASEVVRKSPGISVVDDRFLVVRGLSQRYNNVWLNNTSIPGTETDSRAFGFDLIPGSQIDNLLIYKSPTPELPADFSGGFVKIMTKSRAENNSFAIQYGTAFLQGSTLAGYSLPEGSAFNYLGIDNGYRALPVNFPGDLKNVSVAKSVSFTRAMDNDFTPVNGEILPDQKLLIAYSHSYPGKRTRYADNFASLSYGVSSKHLSVENRRYGIFDIGTHTNSLYNDFTDIKDSRDVKIALLYNWVFNLSDKFRFEVRNLFNQFGQSSYTSRSGTETYSGEYDIRSYSDQYFSRSVYAGQINGQYNLPKGVLDCTAGYSRSSRNAPDRRIVTARRNVEYDDSTSFGNFRTESNDIKRLFQNLNENTYSGALNYKHQVNKNKLFSEYSAGLFSEFRNRNFNARNFSYDTGNGLTSEFYNLKVSEMLTDKYINEDGIYIYETSNKSDSYDATNLHQAFYYSTVLKIGSKISLYPGFRVEYNEMTLNGYDSDGIDKVKVTNGSLDLFPSVNGMVSLNKNNQVRVAYGRSVNRPEFREIAPYVFYDFDAFSYFEGNPDLKNAYINSYEVRYEFYPHGDDLITAGLFYKKFNSPIEMTYYETGGSLQYTYANAESAIAQGFELEIRKSLEFIGLKGVTCMFNGAWINSRVTFSDTSIEKDRPMQGQSPYILNAGLFYSTKENRFSLGLNYNRIGKRIIAVGQVYQNDYESIPDIYEMPRDLLNLSVSAKMAKHLELSFTVKDILNYKSENKQLIDISTDEFSINKTLITKSYRPGRYVGISLGIKF